MAEDEAYMAVLQERHAAVDALLNQQKRPDALVKSLENPPFGVKSTDIKDVNYQIVAKAMAACKDAEIETIVAGLDPASCDNLMKYVYKGLGLADNSGQLLKWHAKLVTKAGVGSIMRTLADRKTV